MFLPDQISLCDESLRELSNPGASGSIFYLTRDDEFILKTVSSDAAYPIKSRRKKRFFGLSPQLLVGWGQNS